MANPAEPHAALRRQRPDPTVLSEAIPLFFIGRNRDGLWIAREADGRVGGLFWCKISALRFAEDRAWPMGCATVFFTQRFDLDIENRGNPLAARLGVVRRVFTKLAHSLGASPAERDSGPDA